MKDRIPVRVLIIDDEEAVCRRVAETLITQHCEVERFTDSRAGIEHARTYPCDIAIVDLHMPEIVGAEVLARLRKARPALTLFALTAFPTPELTEQARAAGAAEILEKPVRPGALTVALQRQLERHGIQARTEDEFNRRLGSALRRVRRETGQSQQDVALAAAITPPQLSQIESGKTATSTWTLARLAAALRRPLTTILENL